MQVNMSNILSAENFYMNEEDIFEVEAIKGHRWDDRIGAMQFLTKWKGYKDRENTWQSVNSLISCPQIMAEYLANNPEALFKRSLVVPSLVPMHLQPLKTKKSKTRLISEESESDNDLPRLKGVNFLRSANILSEKLEKLKPVKRKMKCVSEESDSEEDFTKKGGFKDINVNSNSLLLKKKYDRVTPDILKISDSERKPTSTVNTKQILKSDVNKDINVNSNLLLSKKKYDRVTPEILLKISDSERKPKGAPLTVNTKEILKSDIKKKLLSSLFGGNDEEDEESIKSLLIPEEDDLVIPKRRPYVINESHYPAVDSYQNAAGSVSLLQLTASERGLGSAIFSPIASECAEQPHTLRSTQMPVSTINIGIEDVLYIYKKLDETTFKTDISSYSKRSNSRLLSPEFECGGMKWIIIHTCKDDIITLSIQCINVDHSKFVRATYALGMCNPNDQSNLIIHKERYSAKFSQSTSIQGFQTSKSDLSSSTCGRKNPIIENDTVAIFCVLRVHENKLTVNHD
jgi:hypothetical protein